MPFVKDSLSLLIEASSNDLLTNTSEAITEGAVRAGYASIEEAVVVPYDPQVVPVINIEGHYYTEMNFLHPYMKSNGIKSIAEALNNVATANGLPEKAVGLLIESETSVDDSITQAIESGNQKKKDSVFSKVDKAVGISKKLKKAGFDVKKKKSAKEGCCSKEGCSKEGCTKECNNK